MAAHLKKKKKRSAFDFVAGDYHVNTVAYILNSETVDYF